MPPHTHYVEPYFGAGSVLFEKSPEGVSEVVNDLNGDLMHFWSVLRDPELFDTFKRYANLTPFSETEWKRAVGTVYLDSNVVVRALSFFVKVRQSLVGRGKQFTALSRTRVRRGMNEQVSSWLSAVEGLEAVHARLRRVVILNRPALDVIRSEDGPQTLFYLDPPYLHETRATTEEYGEHEMSVTDHEALLDSIVTCKGTVMISGYESNLYHRRLSEWTVHTREVANHASHKRSKERKVECVWINR